MARLSSGHITLEIKFRDIDLGWVQYDVRFLWNDKNIVNKEVLKGGSDYWDDRKEHAFRVNESDRDSLIPFLETVLATNQADYWEPIEPDMILEILPNRMFPFSEQSRSEGYYTIIAMIDEYNFENCIAYSGDGLALIMACNREQLTDFLNALKEEYEDFRKRFGIN